MTEKTGASFRLSDGTGDPLTDARLAAIVESSFDAIVSKDLNGIIASWNPAAERLFGYTAKEAIGQSILMLIPDSRLHEEEMIIERIRRGEQVESFETVRRRKDGRLIPVYLTVSPIRTADGRIIGASKIARDVSESHDSERRIRLLLREVNHRVKNQYAVILSMVRETLQNTVSSAEFESRLRERIMSLARSHDLLVTADWKGASLEELVVQQVEPFRGETPIAISGPPIAVQPTAVQHLGMALHELASNSDRFGVLAHGGTIAISWGIEDKDGQARFRLSWKEEMAEPLPAGEQAGRRGFGSLVLQRVAAQALRGKARYERNGGLLEWTLSVPLREVVEEEARN
jgi:PAS domain S-box-containing protein